jgi:hypothetical protein
MLLFKRLVRPGSSSIINYQLNLNSALFIYPINPVKGLMVDGI